MKKLKTITAFTAIFALLLFTACSDDDDDSTTNSGGNTAPASSSAISFDSKSYNMLSGLILDYGSASVLDSTLESHYNMDFYMLDGTLTLVQDSINDDEYIASNNSTILVYVELFSPDTTSFKTGTFTFIDEDSVTVSSTSGKYFFTYGEVELDNDGVVNGDFDGPEFDLVGGSVVVSGTPPSSYTLNYNLQVEGGRTLTGTYNGSFIYRDDK